MSVRAMAWVLRNSRATLGSRLVLLSLADYADEDGGSIWPSVKTICSDTLLSERQVQYALRNLEQLGEIAVEQKGGGRRTTRYRILMREVQNPHPSEQARGAVDCTPEVQPIAPDPSVEPPELQNLAAAPRNGHRKIPKQELNRVWDALAYIFGAPTTRTAETLRGRVVSSLAAAGASPDEIMRRARAWPQHFDSATLTAAALEKHWDTLGRKPLRRQR